MRTFFLFIFLYVLPASLFAKDLDDDAPTHTTVVPISHDSQPQLHRHITIDQNLFLRPIRPEDSAVLSAFFTDPHMMEYWGEGKTYTQEEVHELIARFSLDDLSVNNRQSWTLIVQEDIAGFVFIRSSEPPYENYAELMYGILHTHQGKGLSYHAAHSVMSYVNKDFIATVHPDNIGSIKILERLGFLKDEERLNAVKYGHPRLYYVKKK